MERTDGLTTHHHIRPPGRRRRRPGRAAHRGRGILATLWSPTHATHTSPRVSVKLAGFTHVRIVSSASVSRASIRVTVFDGREATHASPPRNSIADGRDPTAVTTGARVRTSTRVTVPSPFADHTERAPYAT